MGYRKSLANVFLGCKALCAAEMIPFCYDHFFFRTYATPRLQMYFLNQRKLAVELENVLYFFSAFNGLKNTSVI